ncbi:hypothetical protein AWB71_00339 [Caballeronia peredens]|nr:hypothetical protein AWB71_00339 [Caballeronia peredens]
MRMQKARQDVTECLNIVSVRGRIHGHDFFRTCHVGVTGARHASVTKSMKRCIMLMCTLIQPTNDCQNHAGLLGL